MKNDLKGEVNIHHSILERAINNDSEALKIMFGQFIPEDEQVYLTQYLGLKGIWGMGTHSFACVTNRRIADISVGRFSEVIYQDGYLEFINSTVLYQPSKLALYLFVLTWLFLGVPTAFTISVLTTPLLNSAVAGFIAALLFLIFIILLTPYMVKLYYRNVKCGIIFWIREGVPIYVFSNRKFIKRANMLCRDIALYREKRLKIIQEGCR
jgi:hypothetical protein